MEAVNTGKGLKVLKVLRVLGCWGAGVLKVRCWGGGAEGLRAGRPWWGRGLVYVSGSNFWSLDLERGTTRQLTELPPAGQIGTFDITADGTTIVFDRWTDDSNIVLIERER